MVEYIPAKKPGKLIFNQNEFLTYPCALEGTLLTLQDTVGAKIEFFNHAASTTFLYWIDYRASRHFFSELASGQSLNINTYLHQSWLVTDQNNECIEIIKPLHSVKGIVIISDQ